MTIAQLIPIALQLSMVSHAGTVVEKDLGPSTDAVARAMTRFNPDASWHKAPVP